MSAPVRGLDHYIRVAKGILKRLKERDTMPMNVAKLLKHSRHQRIRFRRNGMYKAFVMDRNIALDGLTKRLKGTFWNSSTAPRVKQGEKPAIANFGANGCYARGWSWRHGRRVHEDFARIVKCVTHQTTVRKGGSAQIRSTDPCAFRMFMYLVRKNIVPLLCEMAIFDEPIRIATAIDCIAYDSRRDRLVAIEIKTGHETQRNYGTNNGKTKLTGALSQVPDSPLNRAAIQLMVSLLMILRRYHVQVDDAFVLRPISQGGIIQKYDMPRWILDDRYQKLIYCAMRRSIGMTQDRREFNRPLSKQKRTELENKEAAQKAIEQADDPHAELYWYPSPPAVAIEPEPAPLVPPVNAADEVHENESERESDSESSESSDTDSLEELFGSAPSTPISEADETTPTSDSCDSEWTPRDPVDDRDVPSPPRVTANLEWEDVESDLLDFIHG